MARETTGKHRESVAGRQTNASKGEGETDRRKRVRIFLALRK